MHGSGSPPFKYNWPGIIATLALILINLVSRDDLTGISSSGDPGDDVRLITLFFYLMHAEISSFNLLNALLTVLGCFVLLFNV